MARVLCKIHVFYLFCRGKMILVQLLLLLSGDVELNPGPPKRGVPAGAPKKEEKTEAADVLSTKVRKSTYFIKFY